MEAVPCEIIKDLLPLYADEVCSAESAGLVEGHLAQCENCRVELNKIKAAIHLPQEIVVKHENEAAAIKGIAGFWRRSKLKAFALGLLGAALLFGVYVGLFQWKIMKLPAGRIEISEVSKLSDGTIVYLMKVKDEYDINFIKYDMDADGNFYLTPLRPVVKSKAIVDRFQNWHQDIEHEKYLYKEKYGKGLKAIYYRTSGEDVLVWKEGMEVPAASKEVEAEFHEANGTR
ncbi:zf-HC2 domain-containing protein [Paenibacillus sp. MMS18-CY102]|uniref:zf-HC2 domain-containing protein n=1 Tax=Paenibacillus sp. MMS18-CY102 TaxID=2682849 RepID=UPI0013665957|nr:zf-HC2 domain-containing protein [Paenibacillus sp. MMS18-CY102]MWC27724.1 hypothetical protein [Paenibacillus sp. MMS18-CY102]